MTWYRMSGSSKGELHGASILVTVDGGVAGESVTITKGTFSKSGKLSEDGTCLFTDLLDAGTYTATYQTFTATVSVSASDILNKVTKSVTIATTTKINLILEGAKEDTITITGKTGKSVGVCVFPSGSTVGEVALDIIDGEQYTFTSSIAKDTTTGTSNYSKTVRLYKDGRHNTSNVGMVPVMTSNTTPSGEAYANSAQVGYEAYKGFNNTNAFNTNAYHEIVQNATPTPTIGYKFVNPTIIKQFRFYRHSNDIFNYDNIPYTIQASNDNSTWIDLYSGNTGTSLLQTNSIANNNAYLYYQLKYSKPGTGGYCSTVGLQFYSKGIKVMPEGALYHAGNECFDLTGGWSKDGWVMSDYTVQTGVKNTNDMYLKGPTSNSFSLLGTQKAISVHKYSKIYALVESIAAYNAWGGIVGVAYGKNWGADYLKSINCKDLGTYIVELDVSSATKDIYIMVDSDSSLRELKVKQVWGV